MTPRQLLDYCERERDWQLDALVALARLESPSDDEAALGRCGADLAERLTKIGGRVTRAGPHVRAAFGPTAGDASLQILLLGHFDTVWPIGTIARMPVERHGGRLHGPGVYDMKGGVAIGLLALRALQAFDLLARPVLFLCTADEEVGSTSSRSLIEDEARRSRQALVLEPALANGGVKTGRKGVGEYRVDVTGIAAHAGVEPEKGASAIRELARQVFALEELAAPELGTTINVGRLEGGTRSNVIAERASAMVDVRVTTAAEAARVDRAIRQLQPGDPRTAVRVTGGINRPPMERTPAVLALYATAQSVARELGRDLREGTTGGASDGNFTAALGVPTLDGLGAEGDGAHATSEHVLIDAFSFRTALLAGLVARLAGQATT
jgi:glutamate carboxypeptidase